MKTDIEADIAAIQRINAVPKILTVASRTTGMGLVAIARVTDDRWVCCAALDQINFGMKPGTELELETTICNEVRKSGEPVIIDDVSLDGPFCKHPAPGLYGFRSHISMPISFSNGALWGSLFAIDPKPHKLNIPEIVDMFQVFAELVATHLETTQGYEISQTNLARSQANLRASQRELSVSEDSLRDERHASELREQFIAVLGHDLRNPLASLEAATRILLRDGLNEKSPEILVLMQKTVVRMARLVDNIMDFAHGRLGGGLTLNRDAKHPLTPVFEQIINELQSAWPERTIESHINLDEPINFDRSKLGQLFSNLIGNALAYGELDAPVRVVASTDKNILELSVTNYGAPISAKAMESLYRPFVRGDRPSKQGLGLGLFIASEIARAHGGTLSATSSPVETIFTFKMPL
jgi:signal transduction histidine kinase